MTAQNPRTIFLTSLTEVSATDIEGVGTVRQEGDAWYRWVYNEGATLAAGCPCCYSLANGANYHNYVSMPVAATAETIAGLVMGALTTTYYGWIMIEGYHSAGKVMQLTNTVLSSGQQLAMCSYGTASSSYLSGVGLAYSAYSTQATDASPSHRAPHVGVLIALGSMTTAGSASRTSTIGVLVHCLTV